MTPSEAFDFGMEKIEKLSENLGINIKYTPYDLTRDHVKNTLKKYGPNGTENNGNRADPEKWTGIRFLSPMSDEQREKIRDLGNYLNMAGMSWDSGGCCEGRDWEWDWSFRYEPKDNQEARESRDFLYELFDEMGF